MASKALALAAVAIWQRAHLSNSAESGQALVTCSIGLGPTDFRTSYFIPRVLTTEDGFRLAILVNLL